MPDRFDKSLLVSPLAEESRPRRLRILGLTAAVLVLGVAVWVLWGDDDPEAVVSGANLTPTTEAIGTSTTASPPIVLQTYTPDPAILYHPTMLPDGWQACRVVDDSSIGDRFCDPTDDESWVQVSVKESDQVRTGGAQPTGDDHNGVWLDRGESNEVTYHRGLRYVVVLNNATIPSSTLLEIAASIPVVSDYDSLYGTPEDRLAIDLVTDEELAALLLEYDDDPTVTKAQFEVQVFAPTVSVYGFGADGSSVPEFAWTIPRPRLVEAGRPIVVGELPDRLRGYAVWDQAGYGWRIEGQITADEAAILASRLIARIAAFPTE